VAAENNLSETAFVELCDPSTSSQPDPFASSGRFLLRWFTPTVEVPLCGHATLATAAALFLGGNASARLSFSTASGDLHVSRADPEDPPSPGPRPVGSSVRLEMELPYAPPSDPLPEGAEALAAAASRGLRLAHVGFNAALRYLLVALEPDSITPDGLRDHPFDVPGMLAAYGRRETGVAAVIVACCDTSVGGACRAGRPQAFSRFFAPWLGIDEDPVTGSAHSVLAPYYGEHVLAAAAGNGVCFRQVSRRAGELRARIVEREGGGKRVVLTGSAVLVLEGTIAVPDEPQTVGEAPAAGGGEP